MDLICEALKKKPKTIEAWVACSDKLMEANGGKANEKVAHDFIKYMTSISKHFDLGINIPTN